MKWGVLTIANGYQEIKAKKLEVDWSDENVREMYMDKPKLVGDKIIINNGDAEIVFESPFEKPEEIK